MSDRPQPRQGAQVLRFGRFELRPLEHQLLADGQPVPLGGRAFDLLLALAQRAGELVTRNELLEQVWPGRVVEENNLSVQINALRKVLGGQWLLTVPGRGYRFVSPLQVTEPSALATPSPVPRPRTRLPTQQALLIGRSDDLAALGTLVDQHRIVTVVGAGGTGKTRLAQALLQLRANAYAQSVCWVELSPVAASDALPAAVAAALEVQLPPGDAMASLAKALKGMDLLLALDNAEHLLDGVALLAQALLDTAPGLRLVVTSQAPLRLASERVLRLGPLSVPQGPLPAQQAQAFGAVALFCDRAAAADHRFVLTDPDAPVVIELCRQLDGLALAIELAAARVSALGPAGLLLALTDRLHVLRHNRNRWAPARQKSLRAALEWSVSLLAPLEQQLFRRLGVLAGKAPLELVQQLGSDSQDPARHDAWAVVDALDQLVQRSLVEVVCEESQGPVYYRLLESPRALALEQLAATDEETVARQRHARAVLQAFDLDERALLAGERQVGRWRRDGEPLFNDVQQALAWARSAGENALALGLAVALLERVPDPQHLDASAAVHICEAFIDADETDLRLACRAWLSVSLLSFRGPQRSQEAATRAMARIQRLGPKDDDRFIRYATLCEVARVRAAGAQLDEADALLDEAQALEAPTWPAVRLRVAPRARAFVASARRQPERALHHLRQALMLSLAAGDPSLATRLNIADMELLAGDAAAAVETGRALVQVLARSRSIGLLQLARLNLGAAHLALQQVQEAREVLQAAWQAARSDGPAWPLRVQCLDLLALLSALLGRHAAAAQLVGAADAQHQAAASQRYPDGQQAHERTLGILRGAFDDTRFVTLHAQGASLGDADVAQLVRLSLSADDADRPSVD